jgi:hypothetical protein
MVSRFVAVPSRIVECDDTSPACPTGYERER